MNKNLEERIEKLGKELEDLKHELDKEKLSNTQTNTRWRGNQNGNYWYITPSSIVSRTMEMNDDQDNVSYEMGNYFRTEEEAEKAVEKIKIYMQLKDLALRLNKGRKIDWTNNNQAKYYIYYDRGTMGLNYYHDWSYQSIGQIYCLNINFLDIAEQEIGEENLKKLFE